jgi:hypothetical protein
MHASTIDQHQALTHDAQELVTAWAGTERMTSQGQVREAIEANCGTEPSELAEIEALLPYVIDACRAAGLLVEVGS